MQTKLLRWLPLLYLLAFATLSVVAWQTLNVVPYGRDAGGHLATSLAYRPLLENPSPTTLFQVLLVNGYRPPILYLSTLPFYAIFGATFDSAGYANAFWLVVGVAGCYALGRQLAGHWAGIMGAMLYLLFPFVHGVARLFYFETALVAFVTWNLYTLLKSEGWSRRGWSLAWGVTLGLGMLTKWTLPATVGLPTLFVLWQAWQHMKREGQKAKGGERHFRFVREGGALAVALIAGVGLALLFLYPNREGIPATLLGSWLYPLFGLTWGITFYVVTRPASRWLNLASGLLIALSLMAVWYYLQPGFILNFVDAAYLTAEGRDEPLDLTNPRTYVYYLHYLFTQLLGPLLALLVLPLVLIPVIVAVQQKRWQAGWDGETATALWLAMVGTYGAFTLASYNSERSMLALLVPLAVLAGAFLTSPTPIPIIEKMGNLWRGLLLVLIGMVGLYQWGLITLPVLSPFWEEQNPLVAKGEFLQPPTAGATDRRYWIAPDVLATMNTIDAGLTSFGMLVNSEGIHRGPFRYLIAAESLAIELMPLTEKGNRWGDVFANEWLLVKDGVNSDVEAEGLLAIERILSGDDYFNLLYTPVKNYSLPDNETATLYYRAEGPAFPRATTEWQSTTQPIARAINAGWRDGAQLLLPDAEVASWLATETITATHVAWIEGIPPDPAASPLFVVVTPTQDPRPVFDQVFYPAGTLETDHATLLVYGQPQQPLQSVLVQAEWDGFQVAGLMSRNEVERGDVLPIELTMTGGFPPNHNVSLRLIDGTGQVVGQIDRPLTEKIRAGIQILPNLPPDGQYSIIMIVYDVTTFAPVPDRENELTTFLYSVLVQ
jgi:hypothetical protein